MAMGSAHDLSARIAEVRRILLRAHNGTSLAREWELEWPTCESRALTPEVAFRSAILSHQVKVVAALSTIALDSVEEFPVEVARLDYWSELLERDAAAAIRTVDALAAVSVTAEADLHAFRAAQQVTPPGSPHETGPAEE